MPNLGTWPAGEFAATEPQAAWNRVFGIPGYGMNPFQAYQAQMAAPAYAGWRGSQLIPGATPAAFDPVTWGSADSGGQSLAAFRAAEGMTAPNQEQWMEDLGSEAALSQLLRGALGAGGRGFSSVIANLLARRVGGLQNQWMQETQGGAAGSPFLTYLRERYGL